MTEFGGLYIIDAAMLDAARRVWRARTRARRLGSLAAIALVVVALVAGACVIDARH